MEEEEEDQEEGGRTRRRTRGCNKTIQAFPFTTGRAPLKDRRPLGLAGALWAWQAPHGPDIDEEVCVRRNFKTYGKLVVDQTIAL